MELRNRWDESDKANSFQTREWQLDTGAEDYSIAEQRKSCTEGADSIGSHPFSTVKHLNQLLCKLKPTHASLPFWPQNRETAREHNIPVLFRATDSAAQEVIPLFQACKVSHVRTYDLQALARKGVGAPGGEVGRPSSCRAREGIHQVFDRKGHAIQY